MFLALSPLNYVCFAAVSAKAVELGEMRHRLSQLQEREARREERSGVTREMWKTVM